LHELAPGLRQAAGVLPALIFMLAGIRDIPFISILDDLVGRCAPEVILCALD